MSEGRPVASVEPLPQVMRQQGAPFPPPDVLGHIANDQLVMVEEVARRWGMPVQPGGTGHALCAGPVADRQVADRTAAYHLPVEALGPDAYALYVGPTEGVVVGGDVRGLQYGLDILFQLLRNPAPIRQTVVHDWTDLPVRGVFVTCRLGPTGPQVVEDLIRHAPLPAATLQGCCAPTGVLSMPPGPRPCGSRSDGPASSVGPRTGPRG